MDDLELLWEFGRSRSPAAFETVARRYVDLIYSAALRQVRDPHVADDVTQAVLIVMMNKAAKLPARTVLPSWLLKVTRYACLDVMKMDARRRRHEANAGRERADQTSSSSSSSLAAADATPLTWEQLAPVVDAALLKLKTQDRDAVVLRYLMNKSPEEISYVLGVSEEAARQRVSRALQRLRAIFARQGIRTMEEALGGILAASAVAPAPPAIAAIALKMGLPGSGALSAPPSVVAKAAARSMDRWNARTTSAVAAGVAVLLGGLVLMNRSKPPKAPDASGVTPVAHPAPSPPSQQRQQPQGRPSPRDYTRIPATQTRLIVAALARDADAVRRFLAAGDDVNAVSRDGNNTTAIVYAAMAPGDQGFDIVKSLLDGGADVDARSSSGGTALMRAVRARSPRTVELLIRNGADVNVKDRRGLTAMDWATQANDAAVLAALRRAEAAGATTTPSK